MRLFPSVLVRPRKPPAIKRVQLNCDCHLQVKGRVPQNFPRHSRHCFKRTAWQHNWIPSGGIKVVGGGIECTVTEELWAMAGRLLGRSRPLIGNNVQQKLDPLAPLATNIARGVVRSYAAREYPRYKHVIWLACSKTRLLKSLNCHRTFPLEGMDYRLKDVFAFP